MRRSGPQFKFGNGRMPATPLAWAEALLYETFQANARQSLNQFEVDSIFNRESSARFAVTEVLREFREISN
jgi:hypothetical protein